jgi:hypothetical protein
MRVSGDARRDGCLRGCGAVSPGFEQSLRSTHRVVEDSEIVSDLLCSLCDACILRGRPGSILNGPPAGSRLKADWQGPVVKMCVHGSSPDPVMR